VKFDGPWVNSMFGPDLVLTSEASFLLLLQVINVSSPNTPGLRKLQGRKQLKDLVKKVCSCLN